MKEEKWSNDQVWQKTTDLTKLHKVVIIITGGRFDALLKGDTMSELKDLVRLRTQLYNEMVDMERQAVAYQQKAEILRRKLNHVALAIQAHADRPPVKAIKLSDGTKFTPTKKQVEELAKKQAANMVDAYLRRMQNND